MTVRSGGLRRMLKSLMLKHGPHMITCQEFEDFILDYLDDNLPPGQRRIFELHMKICRECRDYLAAYQRSIELGKAVFEHPDSPISEDVPEDLVQAILDARQN